MDYKKKRKIISLGFLILVILGSTMGVRYTVQKEITRIYQKEAKTVLTLFYENLAESFENLNYASQLSDAIGTDALIDSEKFTDKAQNILMKHQEIISLAYFEGDKLVEILPESEYSQLKGKDLSEFSYSYTLAKVTKEAVIEGPEQLTVNNKNVFYFIDPIVKDNEYKGEIVAILDKESVISQMKLNLLEEGGYDYELWRVNELGEHKTVIVTSDKKTDFSDGVKLSFNLPANWNISIIPQNGWFTNKQELITNIGCIISGLLLLFMIILIYQFINQRQDLQKAKYTDPESGLLSHDGFLSFVDYKIKKNKQTQLSLLYIRLPNFRMMSIEVSRREVLDYFDQMNKNIKENFPAGTLVGRLEYEAIAVAFFTNINDEKNSEIIEDFVIQLFWKKLIHDKKEFVDPQYCVVTYPGDGSDAAALIKQAKKSGDLLKE